MASIFSKTLLSVAMLPLMGLALPAAASAQADANNEISEAAVDSFYNSRDYRPIWVQDGQVKAAAGDLIEILKRADLDGMESGPERARMLERSIEAGQGGDPRTLARLDAQLTSAWVDYVRTLKRPVDVGMVFLDPSLRPSAPAAERILEELAEAPSVAAHLKRVSELNPHYAQLREGLAALRENPARDVRAEQRLRINLDRARVLPAAHQGKYVLVDAATQRLYMYEDGVVRDSMKVIVGKPEEQTPMLAGLIKYSVLNPYWNVPPDLAQRRVAAGVLKDGVGYLKTKRYELLSDWSDQARVLDPSEVDWHAVAAGQKDLRVRQLPGSDNAMGKMKFAFPNDYGVFLHDTPDKVLFSEDQRSLSSGCVRVEDASRLGRWMFGKSLQATSSAPEQQVDLDQPIPVYITYLTAAWDGTKVAMRQDFYGRDKVAGQSYASRSTFAAE